jgi:1-carboxybiuret hydrolase subunit AtzG-like protein
MPGKAKTAPKIKSPARRARAQTVDAADALIAACAQALRLPIDPAWHPAVRTNIQLLLKHAALVEEFLLPDEAEPAPVFRA